MTRGRLRGHLRGICAASVALAVGALVACSTPEAESVRRLRSDIVLPAGLHNTIIEGRVPLHATLDGLLRAHQVGADVAQAVISAARSAFNLKALRVGQPYRIVTLGGLFRAFEYEIDNDRFLRVAGGEPARAAADIELTAAILPTPKHRETAAIRGHVDANHSSMIAAVNGAGERTELALRLADIFGGQIDFNADLQPGDEFDVLFEKDTRDGAFAGYGAVIAATLVNGSRTLQAFRFERPDGTVEYFDEEGRSSKRFFLSSPLPFTPRVTSRFSSNRMHPVHGVPRAHLGVDYAAPSGTPVRAVADAVVVSAGFSGASGRMVQLRHANGYRTYYLHLSSIAAHIRPGARVSQGDLLGAVGASGVVTGPHLDYRLSRNGVFVDPIREHAKLPPGVPVSNDLRPAFEAARDAARQQLSSRLQNTPRGTLVAQ